MLEDSNHREGCAGFFRSTAFQTEEGNSKNIRQNTISNALAYFKLFTRFLEKSAKNIS